VSKSWRFSVKKSNMFPLKWFWCWNNSKIDGFESTSIFFQGVGGVRCYKVNNQLRREGNVPLTNKVNDGFKKCLVIITNLVDYNNNRLTWKGYLLPGFLNLQPDNIFGPIIDKKSFWDLSRKLLTKNLVPH